MKITHNKVGQNLNLTDASRATQADKSKKSEGATANSNVTSGLPFASSTDSAKVDLSARAKDIQRAKDIAKASPEVDLAKVEKFQKLIDDGKYKVDSKAIAERMVEEHLMSAGKTSDE